MKKEIHYEKRLSTSRYEFRRLAFNQALPGQGSDCTRAAEDPDPGGGQVEKPDAEARTWKPEDSIPVWDKKRPDARADGRFFIPHRYTESMSKGSTTKEGDLLREASFDF